MTGNNKLNFVQTSNIVKIVQQTAIGVENQEKTVYLKAPIMEKKMLCRLLTE